MAKDYKHRAQNRSKGQVADTSNPLQSLAFWKWMLMATLAISSVVFLVSWQVKGTKKPNPAQSLQNIAVNKPLQVGPVEKAEIQQPIKAETQSKPKPPRFDFYTILPEKEVVVPDYEINTRTREERVGKAKETHYMMQAGSFKSFKEADQLRAKLGLLGIETTVHKAKVGSVIWYRVKIGPYTQMASVSAIKSRLRQNSIDVIVTETGE
jgi:cell division protein FtsN